MQGDQPGGSKPVKLDGAMTEQEQRTEQHKVEEVAAKTLKDRNSKLYSSRKAPIKI